MMHEDTRKELERLLAVVEEKLATLPTFTWETRSQHTSALDRVRGQLERSEGARFRDGSGGNTIVLLAGVRSSSVMGAEFALRNWIKATRDLLQLGASS